MPLPGGGAASQTDLWVLASAGQQLVSMAIEGKVAESFDVTLGEWMAAESQGRQQRWAFLCELLQLPSECDRAIRYQLVHRTASAILQAKKHHASMAVLLVHSFSASHQWFDDFAAFVRMLGAEVKSPGELVDVGLRSGINLFAGWAAGPKVVSA